jgi:hypothetical protein
MTETTEAVERLAPDAALAYTFWVNKKKARDA